MKSAAPDEFDPLVAPLRAIAETRSRALTDHPSLQEWVDYHLGSFPPEAAGDLHEHLSLCRECARLVLDLKAFSRSPSPPLPEPGVDLEAEWGLVEARLQREDERPSPRARPRRAWALAALLVLALGLLAWSLALRQSLGRPRIDFALASLEPDREGRERTAEAPAQVLVQPDRGQVLLLLNLGDLREFPGYRIELVDSRRGVLWAASGVRRNDDGTFLLEYPARGLEPRLHEIRLYGERDGERLPVAVYSFEVVFGHRLERAP